ncbi:MAG: hypothetical protein A3H98_07805 [Bacteroidetes bacterium RIFCSPLOWO2_02_FULL_36_8]|nr:MAG: hypothetical protein A3H98_07805 [Bacteroidetes bacterium RIFCSPLOWO2_02_FULL_36_8]OFY69013.1 MAG: hypothetical protein A3G23_13100 [Bacteroidetes bacterium RIFCSPLOWO2_12_FULL_37_12]
MNDSINLLGVIKVFLRRKKVIGILTILALIGSIIITSESIMPPYFKSSCIFYPSNPLAADQQSLFGEKEISSLFGAEAETDRMLSIGNSPGLSNFIIEKFNLLSHYEIDTVNNPDYLIKVAKKFQKNFEILKTQHGALSVNVWDTDKNLAADIANEVVRKMDEMYDWLVKGNQRKVLDIYEQRYNQQQKYVQDITDSLTSVKKKYGTYNILMQSEVLSNSIAASQAELSLLKARLKLLEKFYNPADSNIIELAAMIKGYEEKINSLISPSSGSRFNLESFSKGVEITSVLEDKRKAAVEELNQIKAKYERYLSTINQKISNLFIVERAAPAPKKDKPIRWLIVLASSLGTFLLSLITAIVVENYQSWKTKLNE